MDYYSVSLHDFFGNLDVPQVPVVLFTYCVICLCRIQFSCIETEWFSVLNKCCTELYITSIGVEVERHSPNLKCQLRLQFDHFLHCVKHILVSFFPLLWYFLPIWTVGFAHFSCQFASGGNILFRFFQMFCCFRLLASEFDWLLLAS